MRDPRPALPIRASVVGVLALLAGCSRGPVAGAGSDGPNLELAADDSRDFGPLPDFRLTASSGEEVTKADLLGRPLVIAALFTTCSGPCPRLAAGLRELRVRDEAELSVGRVDEAVGLSDILAAHDFRLQRLPQPAGAQYLARGRAVGRKLRIGNRKTAKRAGLEHAAFAVHVIGSCAP